MDAKHIKARVDDLQKFRGLEASSLLWHLDATRHLHGAWSAIANVMAREDLRPQLEQLVRESCQE